METINVETIIEQIKREIQEKGYSPSDLSFMDAEEITGLPDSNSYDFGILDENLNMANQCCNVNCYQPLTGNKVAVLIKKLIRKCTSFFVVPVVVNQNEYNAYSVRTLNQIRYFILENAELQKTVSELEERVSELEHQVSEIEGGRK